MTTQNRYRVTFTFAARDDQEAREKLFARHFDPMTMRWTRDFVLSRSTRIGIIVLVWLVLFGGAYLLGSRGVCLP